MYNPALIKFESTNDIVDYVTKGLPPTNAQFGALVTAIRFPVDGKETHDGLRPGYDVIIHKDDIENWRNPDKASEEIIAILTRVHHNRVVARNIAIGVGVAVAFGAIAVAMKD